MTKTLTEQWREGTLPVGNYYIKLVGDVERIDFFEGLEWEMTKDFGIEEVVATVPSYQEFQRLQEQLKEANDIIISVAAMPRFPVNPELCREYLEKWGVK